MEKKKYSPPKVLVHQNMVFETKHSHPCDNGHHYGDKHCGDHGGGGHGGGWG